MQAADQGGMLRSSRGEDMEVVAFDGSAEIARLASERTGLKVLHLTFDQIDWRDEFDGVWACASLLHLPSRSSRQRSTDDRVSDEVAFCMSP